MVCCVWEQAWYACVRRCACMLFCVWNVEIYHRLFECAQWSFQSSGFTYSQPGSVFSPSAECTHTVEALIKVKFCFGQSDPNVPTAHFPCNLQVLEYKVLWRSRHFYGSGLAVEVHCTCNLPARCTLDTDCQYWRKAEGRQFVTLFDSSEKLESVWYQC